jgi:hypothetical protein
MVRVILRVLYLFVLTTCEYPINRFTNLNPVYRSLMHVTIIITTVSCGLILSLSFFSKTQNWIKNYRNKVDKTNFVIRIRSFWKKWLPCCSSAIISCLALTAHRRKCRSVSRCGIWNVQVNHKITLINWNIEVDRQIPECLKMCPSSMD